VREREDHETGRNGGQPEGRRQPHRKRLVEERLVAVAEHRHAAERAHQPVAQGQVAGEQGQRETEDQGLPPLVGP
jgi:hypothetical protein